MDNLNEFSKLIPLKVKILLRTKNDKINTNIVKKYLLISSKLKFILEKINLFIKIFFGLLKDKIWLIEYLNKEYIFINLKPELVEKKDPPIITNIKYMKLRLDWFVFREKPIFDILVDTEKRFVEKSLLKLKKRKKIESITKK